MDSSGGGPSCTVVWLRRDLRLEDNPALIWAARAGAVVPVFIWSPEEEGQFYPGRVSRWWIKQSLKHLNNALQVLGSRLIMRRSRDSLSALLEIVEALGAKQVFYNHLYDPVSLVRDHRVKQGLVQHGIVVQSFNADLLYEPWEVYDEEGQAFTTFQKFWDKCILMAFEPDPPMLPPKQLYGPGEDLGGPTEEQLGLEDQAEMASNLLLSRAWTPGWGHADKALDSFIRGPLIEYADSRAKADSATTSLLSPHMHFGEISVRKIFHEVQKMHFKWKREGVMQGVSSVELFLRSLGFREYSRYLSFNFPFTHERSLLANLKWFPWRVDERMFKAWRQGRTGYPLVDAGMRELWATGWLHNRIRVVVSSFFVKVLQLPWRWGMKYFWDTLLDADLECDVLGWQYISGSLPDGHELDRMENPEVEGMKYDPDGEYVRRWLPELVRLPTEWIHHPWDAPPEVLRAAGIELGVNYQLPIVDMGEARQKLQEALSEMWARENDNNCMRAAGNTEEGYGETMIVVEGSGRRATENMVVERVIVARQKAQQKSSSMFKDQLVPDMVTESTKKAAASILAPAAYPASEVETRSEQEGQEAQPMLQEDAASSGTGLRLEDTSGHAAGVEVEVQVREAAGGAAAQHGSQGREDVMSTAESYTSPSSDRGGMATVPVWSQSGSSSRSPSLAVDGRVPTVPVVPDVRKGIGSGGRSRRRMQPRQGVGRVGPLKPQGDEDKPLAKRKRKKQTDPANAD
ncbi:hypothetical protein CBR_g6351 [Chara braunii]|uniref:Photolyase/cryptochrome alpha/beta domain-containing protein n=1 Tax=Chara braunii TaxID=69332 RepID=A0A388KJL0_CHABU|nr:hypothetical protein CBR_g6351 [Chara braunii]|eukprot:GBG70219.1 hypothetical protein CBR_g6351 [Chara braunii]